MTTARLEPIRVQYEITTVYMYLIYTAYSTIAIIIIIIIVMYYYILLYTITIYIHK